MEGDEIYYLYYDFFRQSEIMSSILNIQKILNRAYIKYIKYFRKYTLREVLLICSLTTAIYIGKFTVICAAFIQNFPCNMSSWIFYNFCYIS